MRNIGYNPAPKGVLRLPARITALYQQTMEATTRAVENGSGAEDDSKGYALSSYPELRAKQLAAREYAIENERLVLRVLASSSDAGQRTVAAHVLGYARQSRTQIAALIRAGRDINGSVRNNALRALGVLAKSGPTIAAQIPAEDFIAMLSSGSWTDRNKGAFVLEELSRRRNPKLLSMLRARALNSLIEMARWRGGGHAHFPRVLLGRIAGIDETRLQLLAASGQVDQIIEALK